MRFSGCATAVLACLWTAAPAAATPNFARQHAVDCSFCHTAPPKLNQRGEDFLAEGFRLALPMPLMPSHRTAPVAVWNTFDLDHRQTGAVKGFPGRVELIAAGPIARGGSYFVELRAVSLQVGADGRLLNRSGRFEDVFVTLPVSAGGAVSITVGQFRALEQVDVSRRLGVTEPLAFSASLPPPATAPSARLAAVRAFSPAGRQPAVRVTYHRQAGRYAADGWYTSLGVPWSGELTVPLSEGASFELKRRPKGVFAETYYRSGLASIGGHVFAGDGRGLGQMVAAADLTRRWAVMGALGVDRARERTAARYSTGAEFVLSPHVVLGARIDHRTTPGSRPAVPLYVNGHLPFGPAQFRQALRLQIEHTRQPQNVRTAVAVSHVF